MNITIELFNEKVDGVITIIEATNKDELFFIVEGDFGRIEMGFGLENFKNNLERAINKLSRADKE